MPSSSRRLFLTQVPKAPSLNQPVIQNIPNALVDELRIISPIRPKTADINKMVGMVDVSSESDAPSVRDLETASATSSSSSINSPLLQSDRTPSPEYPEHVFIPEGYQAVTKEKIFFDKHWHFLGSKNCIKEGTGDSKSYFLSDNQGSEWLVKPFYGENKPSIIREFIGASIFKEMLAILNSQIIVPEMQLVKGDQAGQFGLFIKMIPGLILNNAISAASAIATPAPLKRKRSLSISSPSDFPLMPVLRMAFGDDDCSPDNSANLAITDGTGKTVYRGVSLDFGSAFSWLFENGNDFKEKLRKNFENTFKMRYGLSKYSGDFGLLEAQLKILAQPINKQRILRCLENAIDTLAEFLTQEELNEIVFVCKDRDWYRESDEHGEPITKKFMYSDYKKLACAAFQLIAFNLDKVLPEFFEALKIDFAKLSPFALSPTSGLGNGFNPLSSSSMANTSSVDFELSPKKYIGIEKIQFGNNENFVGILLQTPTKQIVR